MLRHVRRRHQFWTGHLRVLNSKRRPIVAAIMVLLMVCLGWVWLRLADAVPTIRTECKSESGIVVRKYSYSWDIETNKTPTVILQNDRMLGVGVLDLAYMSTDYGSVVWCDGQVSIDVDESHRIGICQHAGVLRPCAYHECASDTSLTCDTIDSSAFATASYLLDRIRYGLASE